jgi:HlyD family secretion protein
VGLCAALAAGCKKAPPKYETTKIERGKIVAKVTATGTLSALVTVQVGSQVSGRIEWIGTDFNAPVKKNQVIARIDQQLYKASVEQARANQIAAEGALAKAKAQADDAKVQAQRSTALAEQHLVAASDRDTAVANSKAADANVEAMRGQLEQAKAQTHQAQINLDLTTIISPVSGTVISRSVDVGQTVAASLSAPTLFTIAEDLRKMQVDTNVAEADVGKISAGMDVTFTVDAYTGVKWRGKVRQIRNAAQTVQNVVTYDAVIDVENPELKLRPGMTANVTFVYAEKDDVLRVANAALRFRPAAAAEGERKQRQKGQKPAPDERTVYLAPAIPGGELLARPIKTGITDGSFTEIASGDVAAGDTVVTEAIGDAAKAPGGPGRRPF